MLTRLSPDWVKQACSPTNTKPDSRSCDGPHHITAKLFLCKASRAVVLRHLMWITVSFLREKLKDVLNTTRTDVSGGRDPCSLSSSPITSPGAASCRESGPSPSSCQGPHPCEAPDLNPSLCQAHRSCQGPGHMSSQCHGPAPGPGPCAGSDQGPTFPSLPDSLLSEGPSLASIPDSLNSSSSSLPPIPDILSPMPVYPAGVLLVCNSCMAYQQLVEGQSPMRKWALRRKNEPIEARLQRLERERTAKKNKRACETEEERELRRLRDREAKRMQRMQESEEQRARRLQRDREAMRLKRANETPEKRQARLIREREAKRIKRRLEKIDPALRTQIEHDPAAMAALTADMSLFQFPCPMPVSSIDNGLFMKLPWSASPRYRVAMVTVNHFQAGLFPAASQTALLNTVKKKKKKKQLQNPGNRVGNVSYRLWRGSML